MGDSATTARELGGDRQWAGPADDTASRSGTRVSNDGRLPGPEIAIVTITKDDPAGIRNTIASVEQQDFSLYEQVVVNGGSTTDVAAWLASWRDRDPVRHILIENPPDGIYPAMNAGIRSTCAPIILILNGGDLLKPGTLRCVANHYKQNKWRWAYGGCEGRKPDGRLTGRNFFTPFSKGSFRAGVRNIPHPAAYVTRDLYDEVGLYREDLGTGADQEFFLRSCLVAEPAQIPDILAVFLKGGVSSQEGRIGREISWHRMRIASDTAFGGHAATDLVVTVLLVARRFVVDTVRRIRKLRKGLNPDVPAVS